MKWCFLVNPAPLIIEFFGKLAKQIAEEGGEYIVVANSKIAEYDKKKYFPKDVKIFSEVDWCIKNYQKNQKEFQDLSWKEFFPEFDRFNRFKVYDFSYPNSVEIVAQSYQFADFIFREEKPDVIVGEPPTGVFSEIFSFFSEKYKATYLGLMTSRINGRIDIYDSGHTCSHYEKTFKQLNDSDMSEEERKFAQDFIKSFISHKKLPSYMDYQNQHIRLGGIGRIKGYFKREKEMAHHYLKYLSKRKYFRPFDYNSEFLINYISRYPKEALKSRFRALSQRNIFDSLNNNDKFFIYPLQLQPEASTAVRAMYFCDHINTIKNIAFSLPFPYKLYIKEHPSAIGTKPGYFYKKIKEIPNTVLVSPYESVENLIKKSQGLVVLTSTMGMEALLAGKPVYVLGDVSYDYHPLCRNIDSFKELRQRIQKDLAQKPVLKNLKNINIRFFVSYLKNTVAGSIITAGSNKDTNNYKKTFRDIKRIFFSDEVGIS